MICRSCGIENKDDATICAHCGKEVLRAQAIPHGRACHTCGSENLPDSKFCARCGADLRRHVRAGEPERSKRQRKRKLDSKFDRALQWHPAKVTLALLGVVSVLTIGLQMWQKTRTPLEPVPVMEVKGGDPKLDAGVLAVASRFICSCGTCGQEPLDVCACERAIEERQFIRNSLQTGKSVDQVTAAVDETYGWKKTDVKSTNGSAASGSLKVGTIGIPSQSAGPLTSLAAKSSGKERVAAATDREEVFSHFRCPCGRCGMDDLNACNCQHPRGAREVKGFVDEKIVAGKLTVAELISEVDQKYGGRKK
jgi:cytochrome c-type biogenesis protein CcmH/NrfF